MTPSILSIRGLQKRYGHVTAVNGIDLDIPEGTCFGLLGPNGAGKTTTIEIVEGIIDASAGQVLYKGEPRARQFTHEIGIQFQHTALLGFLTVRENLEIFRSLYPQGADLEALIDLCQLRDFQDRYTDKISGGQRQRFLVALALVNQPQLLFLDEPSTGLDPQARRHLWDIILQIKAQGRTVVLTTHYMEEAQFLCDQVAIMDHGQIIAQGSPEGLIKSHCQGIRIRLPSSGQGAARHRIKGDVTLNNGYLEIVTQDLNGTLSQLMAEHMDLTEMQINTPNLETVFLNLTGRRLRD